MISVKLLYLSLQGDYCLEQFCVRWRWKGRGNELQKRYVTSVDALPDTIRGLLLSHFCLRSLCYSFIIWQFPLSLRKSQGEACCEWKLSQAGEAHREPAQAPRFPLEDILWGASRNILSILVFWHLLQDSRTCRQYLAVKGERLPAVVRPFENTEDSISVDIHRYSFSL